MLSCREVVERSSDYLDQELPLVRRLSFRMHVFLCRNCNGFVDGVRQVIGYAPCVRGHGDPEKYGALSDALISGAVGRKPTDA